MEKLDPRFLHYTLNVQLKKLADNAVVPKYGRDGDVGLDFTATEMEVKKEDNLIIYNTGIAIKIPEGHFGMLVPRSSSFKNGQRLKNSIGIIDSNFTGEMKFMYSMPELDKEPFQVGDRIGQLIILPYPKIQFDEVDELPVTNRGANGWGSSGR